MSGRNGCLLFVAFVLAITSFSVGQGKPFVRFAPRIPTDPPSVYLPGRIVRSPRPPISPPGAFGFPQFAQAAGKIFSGRVTNIERRPATRGQSVETVAVTFHVENAIRGATPGQNLTIRQWIGLWSSGRRYGWESAFFYSCIQTASWD